MASVDEKKSGHRKIIMSLCQGTSCCKHDLMIIMNIYIYIYNHDYCNVLTLYSLRTYNHGSLRYPAKTITDADYADDIAILANTPNQAETLLHSLERANTGIGLHVNAHKTEHMCLNQAGDISTPDGRIRGFIPFSRLFA